MGIWCSASLVCKVIQKPFDLNTKGLSFNMPAFLIEQRDCHRFNLFGFDLCFIQFPILISFFYVNNDMKLLSLRHAQLPFCTGRFAGSVAFACSYCACLRAFLSLSFSHSDTHCSFSLLFSRSALMESPPRVVRRPELCHSSFQLFRVFITTQIQLYSDRQTYQWRMYRGTNHGRH